MLIRNFPSQDRFIELAREYNVVPVCMEILADMETPVSLLTKCYRNKGPIFLLESVEGGEKWGRFSFLGISARSNVQVFRDVVKIVTDDQTETIAHHNDPLTVLKTIMDRYRAAQLAELPRFWGGLVGYLTYEMVSFFERIPNLLPSDKPVAHFMLPEELLIFDNIQNTLMCISVGFIDQNTPEAAAQVYAQARKRLEKLSDIIKTPLQEDQARLATSGSA